MTAAYQQERLSLLSNSGGSSPALSKARVRYVSFTADGMARIVERAYALNPIAKGKARKRALREVLDRILRDYTPDSSSLLVLEKI